jgi:hypothetical protein
MVPAGQATLVQRVIDEIWNAGDLDLADELFAPAFVNHGGLIPDLVSGPEGVKFSVAFYRRAFPDLEISADDVQTNGETVTLRWRARSRSPTDLAGNASADGTDVLTGETRMTVAGDQVVESWTSWNAAEALERLNVFERGDDETS